MSYRTIQLHANKKHQKQINEVLNDPVIIDQWLLFENDQRVYHELLVRSSDTQKMMDKIQTFMGIEIPDDTIGVAKEEKLDVRVIVGDVMAVWPRNDDEEKKRTSNFTGLSREELYENVSRSSEMTTTYFLLVILSTVVAAIGMIENDTAVVVGAMVIAPLLGPNLALGLASALADFKLMLKAAYTNLAGLAVVIGLGFFVGQVLPTDFSSEALMRRTSVNYEGIVLAISAGAAGVLSLATGVSSVLVGVMVAVALLPPATAVGIMLGAGQYTLAGGAALLLMVNIVCINLSAKVVFLLKGVGPRTWYKKKLAKKTLWAYLAVWTITLGGLAFLINYAEGIDAFNGN